MKNISSLQVTLISILVMVAHHYRLPVADAEITALVAGGLALISSVWQIYSGWKSGTHNLGGFKK